MSMVINPFWTAAPPFTFGFNGAHVLNESWGGFPGLGIGNDLVASASGTIDKLWVRTGTTGISADVRVNLYATTSNTDWDALLATGTITGGIAASTSASVSITPVAIVNGTRYGWGVQASANNVNFSSVSSAGSNQFWVDGYADGPQDPGPNPTNNNGFNRAPAVWGSN